MPLSVGAKLDGYEVLGPIGAGGMGEVYRARDSALRREVAIKVLPAFYSQDPDRLLRFEQEAQAAAALNHPNILAVHQFGTFQGAPYLVSELLEGSTLRQVLDGGALPVRKVIDVGVQIAHGLAAAHERGIVHRDLKPENLFVTKNGRVKILDFGLAKLMQPQPDPAGIAATQATGTQAGMVLGTVGYMAPEQVRGKAVDYRADIFAFGAILYEMLAGKRAFQRSTTAETMAAILNDEPPAVSQMMQTAPPGLQRVVHRCLEKSPEQRFQSASDLAFALEALSDSGSSQAIAIQPVKRLRWVWLAAGIGVVIACFVIARWRIPPAVPVVESITQLTDDGQPKPFGLVSDVSRIYFNEGSSRAMTMAQVSITGGKTAPIETRLSNPYIVQVTRDGGALQTLIGNEDVMRSSIWKSLWSIPLPAGEPHSLVTGRLLSADVFPDGHILYVKRNGATGADFMAADRDGSNSHTLLSLPNSISGNLNDAISLAISPSGQRILFEAYRNDGSTLYEMAADGSGFRVILKPTQLAGKCCFAWTFDEKYLVYLLSTGRQSDIWALPMETGLLRRSREPVRLTVGPMSYLTLCPNRNGKQIFAVAEMTRGELVSYDMKSQQFLPFLSGGSATSPSFSRDGKWVAYLSYPNRDLWHSRSDGSEPMQLTFPPMQPDAPVLSPDGTKVVFRDLSGGVPRGFLVDMDGGQPRKILENSSKLSWSPDGNSLVYAAFTGPDELRWELRILDLGTGKSSVVPSSAQLIGPWWVGQNALVAGTEDRKKLLTFDFKSQRWSELAAGFFGIWTVTPDSKYLYTFNGVAGEQLERIRFSDRQVETITSLKDIRLLYQGPPEVNVAPDGSPILLRDAGYQEVYSLDVRWP